MEPHRFKWQEICSKSQESRFEELKRLAEREGVSSEHSMKSICELLDKQYKEKNVSKKNTLSRCINNQSITLTDIQDIPVEFFYTYTHNNQVYCDDIRDLYTHFKHNGSNHPIYNRQQVDTKIVEEINNIYQKLIETTTTLKDWTDLFVPPTITPEMILTQKATEFVSRLYYPNDVSYFLKASLVTIKKFILTLKQYKILSNSDLSSEVDHLDLVKLKLLILEILKQKMDDNVIQEMTWIYNNIFGDVEIEQMESIPENPSLFPVLPRSSELDPRRRLSIGPYYSESESDTDIDSMN